MRLLLDSHFVIDLLDPEKATSQSWVNEPIYVSVASLWELAIKVRQGKLRLIAPIQKMENRLQRLGCTILTIKATHVVADLDPWPDTNDPFDRLLLAVCQVEGLRLVTRDRKLIDHPLAWRPAAP